VFQVYGTELIKISDGKLELKIKIMEASHHYDGDHFRICVQLYESPTPELGGLRFIDFDTTHNTVSQSKMKQDKTNISRVLSIVDIVSSCSFDTKSITICVL
jgi:hypothetical protein